MQLDLNKAYDRVSWGFLRLILIQIRLPFKMMKWMMACVTSVSFVVLVNVNPSEFFEAERVLQQGFPLSPLLFLLVIEGFSQLLLKEKAGGRVKDIKISSNLFVTSPSLNRQRGRDESSNMTEQIAP